MRTTSSRLRAAGVVIALALVPATARADTDEQRAIQLFEKGRHLARDGRCAEAIAPLQESLRYAEGVGPLLNLGNCYETLGKSASAHRAFLRAQEVARSRNDEKRRDEARERARAVEKDVSSLLVHVPISIKASAELRVDGEPWPRDRWDVPWPIDAGVHEIELIAPSQPKQIESITVKPKGDHAEWSASLGATSAPRPPLSIGPVSGPIIPKAGEDQDPGSTQRTLAFVTGGLGGVGLVLGTIFGVTSLSQHSSMTAICPTYPSCAAKDQTRLDELNASAQSAGTISTVAIVAGVALIVGGAVLYFTAPARTR